MAHASPLDLTARSVSEVDALLGAAVRQMLAQHRVAVLVLDQSTTTLSFLRPSLLREVPSEQLAEALMSVWDEETTIEFLSTYGGING